MAPVKVDLEAVLAEYQRMADRGLGEFAAAAVLLHTVVHGPWKDKADKFAACVDEEGRVDWELLMGTYWSAEDWPLAQSAACLFRGSVDEQFNVNLTHVARMGQRNYATWQALLQAARTKSIPTGYR